MAFEQLIETPALLREGHIVHFVGGWPSSKDGKWFVIERTQQIKYDVARIVPTATDIDIDFRSPENGGVSNGNLSLLPLQDGTMYELLIGIEGTPLVYPRYANSYFQNLEVTNMVPDTGDPRLRYLGFWDQDDSPRESPKIREHVVADQEPPILRLYSDLFTDERIVLRFIVNRCKLVEISPESLDTEQEKRAREIRSHKWFNY